MKHEKVSDPIPTEILIDIFSRVPWKSVGRFRCVSKFWRSTLGLPYFTELFLVNSLARPRILFSVEVDGDFLFFSSPQPQNPANNSSLVATRYKCFPEYFPYRVCPPLNGLVLLHEQLIYNPVTGESITINLPIVIAIGIRKSLFGYDPINKRFKVLCTTCKRSPYEESTTHHVFSLGSSGEVIRTRTMETEPYDAGYGQTWINGVLYYRASVERGCVIVCFDFSSEKFSFIEIDKAMKGGTLVNYKGKLGVLVKQRCEVVLWVLKKMLETINGPKVYAWC
ncbi:unnamed protein product [Microthlaspi erraticum]|uniref:F-box domain-containing protein n=1 Tax=Microthlaspi erraticum TaxID=1685480 RepID=A0A6D2HSQ9_9BRAS|nr:unnamed protein product [Microthlaspi erraticum]